MIHPECCHCVSLSTLRKLKTSLTAGFLTIHIEGPGAAHLKCHHCSVLEYTGQSILAHPLSWASVLWNKSSFYDKGNAPEGCGKNPLQTFQGDEDTNSILTNYGHFLLTQVLPMCCLIIFKEFADQCATYQCWQWGKCNPLPSAIKLIMTERLCLFYFS